MSQNSNTATPFRDGFAALWHEPVLLPAELTWRWCFGLSALGLGIFSIGFFLDSLKISAADEFLLRTLRPRLLDNALQHILRGSLSRFVLEQVVLILGVTMLWSLATAAGRAATLRRLVTMFSTDDDPQSQEWHFLPIFILQLLRAMWSLIALAVASGFLVYGVIMVQHQRPLRAALVLSFGVGAACFIGLMLNWLFAVAPLFCIRDNADPMRALDRSVGFLGRHTGRLLLLGVSFFVLRLVWAATMCLAFLSPLSLSEQIGARWTALLMAGVALVYFAGADLLGLARLGAYVSLAEDDAHPTMTTEPAILPDTNQPPEIVPILGLA